MKKFKALDIRTIETKSQGTLSFLEFGNDIDFDIKRIYYTYNVPKGVERGGHAHKKLKQVLFCPYGEIEVALDDGINKKIINLDSPEKIIIIEELIWREVIWKKENSVLCVGASNIYDESDYIRNYDEFLGMVQGGH